MTDVDMIWCFFSLSGDFYSLFCILTVVGFCFYHRIKVFMEYITTALSFWINFFLAKQGRKPKTCLDNVSDSKGQVTECNEENNCPEESIETVTTQEKNDENEESNTRVEIAKEEINDDENTRVEIVKEDINDEEDWTIHVTRKTKRKNRSQLRVTTGRRKNVIPSSKKHESARLVSEDTKDETKNVIPSSETQQSARLVNKDTAGETKNVIPSSETQQSARLVNKDTAGETKNVIPSSETQQSARLVNEDVESIDSKDESSIQPLLLQNFIMAVTTGEIKNVIPSSEKQQSARLVNEDVENIGSKYESSIKPLLLQDFITTALPEVSSSPKKNNRRQKKKRNTNKAKFKSMDDSSDTSSTSDLSFKSCYTPPEKTTVYSPLPQYQKLNLDMYALYHEFHNYLMTEDQLKMNGFPEESPANPGRIVIRNSNLAKNSSERRCVRCSSTFHIQPDGTYKADDMCHYHARKQQPYRRGHPYRGDYPCCNGNYMSEGCVTWQYHVTTESVLHDVEFVKTKSKRHLNKVTSCSIYGLDCEMLYTTAGMEVAKVGVVSADGLTVFESFVLPQNQILDYNTLYSGITEKDLKGVTMTLFDVQAYLLKLLNEDSILVGHGLENDLRALRLIHRKVVDTSVVFPHEYSRYKKSLKNLAQEFLNKQIQTSANGHNCIEDARTCMELMLYRIDLDLEVRPPVTQDENKNSILQNTSVPASHPVDFSSPKYSTVYDPWPYSCNYSYCGNSYRGESFYSGFLMPKNYQNSCIY